MDAHRPDATVPVTRWPAHRTPMDLLAAGFPLTLLLDLTDPGGPHSWDLLTHETALPTGR